MSNFIDMTGWKMNEHGVLDSKWTVIDYAGNSKWNCQCECGTKKIVAGTSLRSGASKGCGKCREKAPNTIDETGKQYGRLTVLGPDGMSKDKHKKWLCQCDCGNIVSVIGKNLRSGATTSCGCYRAERRKENNSRDIKGQRFGRLIALEPIRMNDAHNIIWKCQCDCGNYINVIAHYLLNGNTQSCGCMKSRGEQRISQILQDNKICFSSQFYFSDCIAKTNPCRFDFAIFKNNKIHCLIEYQGIQHYDINHKWHTETDDIKREYCKRNNILLIEIPYTDFDKIDYYYLKERCSL